MHPDHYLGPASILSDKTKRNWDAQWKLKKRADSATWLGIEFTPGYSYINSYKDSSLTTITTVTPITGVRSVIYKNDLYDASSVIKLDEYSQF